MTEPQNPSSMPPPPPPKKKRSLPGMPDPDAEVIALSPETLLATNRFVCEICNKGFQRDQNLQLHRRGHNLPWKLRQRASKEIIRKKVYVCPEPSCVHHDPSRALGDLTGVKKHFCRKHGEKKWKCERCSKKYAVKSDWKAHVKTCGTREYKCNCGSLFSRRDSFITHRAFCDVLAEEKIALSVSNGVEASSPPTPPLTPSTSVVSPTLSIQSSDIPENPTRLSPPPSSNATCSVNTATSSCVFTSVLASSTVTVAPSQSFTNLMSPLARSDCPAVTEPTTLSLSSPLYLSNNNDPPHLFPDQHDPPHHYTASPQPALSATALLQKAAQMGASNSASLLRGLGLTTSSSCGRDHNNSVSTTSMQWNGHGHVKQENIEPVADNLGLGLHCGNGGVVDVMMGSTGQPMTRDLLGLSMSGGADLSALALLTSFGGNFDSSGHGGGVRP